MKSISIAEAARLVGVSRQTIYNKVDSGELSKMSNKRIDISELLRVFPDLSIDNDLSNEVDNQVSNGVQSLDNAVDKMEIKYLKEKVETLEVQAIEKDRQIDKLMSMLETMQVKALPAPETVKKRWFFK